MSVADLITRLDHVSHHGKDRWRAVCPAHESQRRTQSLAIRELPDGTVLLKCFAGCGAAEVVASVGMELRELFPAQHTAPADPRRSRRAGHWHAIRQAVQTLHQEALIVAIAAGDIAKGLSLSEQDADRVAVAAGRIRDAIEACI